MRSRSAFAHGLATGLSFRGRSLWNSEDAANRESVLRDVFDENIDWRRREIIAEQLGSSPHGEGSVRYLHIMASGFREFGETAW